MPHRTPAPPLHGFKLSNEHHPHRHRSGRDEWLAADRVERMWQIIPATVMVVLFAAAVVLIVLGFSR